jgi:short-subunit dehydrogenase
MNIEGKRVLITGASRGLGRTLAFEFANAGAAEVFAGTRKTEDAKALRDRAWQLGLSINPIQLDVARDDDVSAVARLAAFDILVNNAGMAAYGNPVTMDFAAAQEEMSVNYFGALRMSRAVAPAMIERGQGMIVNVATAFAKINLPIVGTYCASKAALLSLGEALRAYLANKNVHVMTVMPTTIDTDMSKGADVPKLTTEFVAGEILRHIREESIDPPIGEEAERVLERLKNDPIGLGQMLSQIRA